MCTGTEKTRIVMDDEIHRNIMDIFFKAPFIFKCGTETGGFEELKEARHDTARNKHAAKCPEIERQIAAKRPIMTQNSDNARRQSVQLSASARSVISFGLRFSGRRLSAFTIARYKFTSPGPESTRSAET